MKFKTFILVAPISVAVLSLSYFAVTVSAVTQRCPQEYSKWSSCLGRQRNGAAKTCSKCMIDAIPGDGVGQDSSVCTTILNCRCHSCSIETLNLATCEMKASQGWTPTCPSFKTNNCLNKLKKKCRCPDSNGQCVAATITNECKVPAATSQAVEYIQQVTSAWNRHCRA